MGNTALPRYGDKKIDDLVNRLEIAINALEAHPLANLRIISVTFPAPVPATVRVYHGLGYRPSGYFVVNTQNAYPLLTEAPPANEPDPGNYITFGYSTASTVLIAVY
jgi:hypothetical protein